MTFDEILDQVITLLKRQGRVSYPALKVRFSLSDEYLEALKAEIIEAQQLATDENGRVLVWAGNTAEASAAASPPAQPTPQPVVQAQPATQVDPRPTAPPPDAERRQLTVMFCDLVESTKLSSQLDPEDWREVVRAYQRVCTEVIQRYDGHVAQYLGDGLLIYFGFPVAHEDDAQRAVRTGLGILAALGDLNKGLQQAKGIQLAIRVGVHTGLVVVGKMGGAGRQEQLALGEVPNIASRIEGLAASNTIVISEATYRLIQGYFECQDLGAQTLRGVAQPLNIYRVLGESGVHSRLDIASARGLTPLVGRESEVTLLLERWEQAKDRHGQVVLLTGDAGIGKSRLVQTLKDHVANEPHTRWECRSSEYYQNTALYPITDLIQRTLMWQQEDTPEERLKKLEQALRQYRLPFEESVLLFASLLSLPVPEDRYPPLALSPQGQRQKTLETIVAILLELAERQPLLFILEDLHWTDPTTIELLNLLIDQTPTASILVLLTCRPHFQPAWHHRSYLTEMTLNRLSPTQVEQIVTRMSDGKTFPAAVLQQIITKTDGVPLFVEELTKAIVESGQLKAGDGHYELTGSLRTLTIPATLHDSLMARLDRLMTAKVIAQLGATIGRQFSYALLQAVSPLDEMMLQHELGRLVGAEIIYQRGVPPQATYTFKHALIQDAAYESLLKSTRQHYHQRIAQVLEEQFPQTAETQPELLAHHYTEAGLHEQALAYWQQAGQQAITRSAHVEAIEHLTKGLALLTALPETRDRAQYELRILTLLGSVLMATQGYGSSEVIHTYNRARELCQQCADTPQTLAVFLELARLEFVRAQYRPSLELSQQCLLMAQRQHEPIFLTGAHGRLGAAFSLLGDLSAARTHLEQALSLYHAQPQRSAGATQDPGVAWLSFLAWTLVPLGYLDHALACMHQALTLAHARSHPFSQAFATSHTAFIHQLRREVQAVQEQAEVAIRITTEQSFPLLLGYATLFRGWALAEQGASVEGITQIRQGLTLYRSTGQENFTTYYLALLVEAYGKHGQVDNALGTLDEAFALVEANNERYYAAELHRLKGELLLRQSSENQTEAETCFHHAISIAQNQSAKSWELRAAISLAKLWHQQGKRQEAHDLLAPVYGWFTEGFDTADLQEAKALLDTLLAGR